jgi:hypothetical protein
MNIFLSKLSSSSNLMKIDCCHTLLKDVNYFPTRPVHIYWRILVKFGARELNTITSSSCLFAENRSVNDTFYVGDWNQLHHSFYNLIWFRPTDRHKSCPRKFLNYCALREKRRSKIYIYYSLNNGVKILVLLFYKLINKFEWNSA